MLSLLSSFEERERTRERKCQQRLGKNDRFLTWRTPAPDDLQKRRLVILGQVRFRALQPHSQRGQFRLEDAENVLHVRLGEIVRVDRDVFAAVADRDLDQRRRTQNTNITLSLLRHDDVSVAQSLARKCATKADKMTKIHASKKGGKIKAKV